MECCVPTADSQKMSLWKIYQGCWIFPFQHIASLFRLDGVEFGDASNQTPPSQTHGPFLSFVHTMSLAKKQHGVMRGATAVLPIRRYHQQGVWPGSLLCKVPSSPGVRIIFCLLVLLTMHEVPHVLYMPRLCLIHPGDATHLLCFPQKGSRASF